MEKEIVYVSPQIEVIEVKVENGFASSGGTEQYKPGTEEEF